MQAERPSTQCVTVSIVSHAQQALILPLLDQLDRLSAGLIAKVVLTVNIPEPDVLAGRRWRMPLERIDNPNPQGFGANHNVAFERCDTPWFLVLNPDMRFHADVLEPLVGQAAPRDGVLAPRIYEPAKHFPEPHRHVLTPYEILARRRPGYAPPAAPTWIPGMFMLCRARAYREVDGFDTRYFMYGEDFDLCIRLQLKGWTIGVAEDLFAVHHAQRASQRLWRHKLWHLRSLARVWTSAAFWRYLLQPRA